MPVMWRGLCARVTRVMRAAARVGRFSLQKDLVDVGPDGLVDYRAFLGTARVDVDATSLLQAAPAPLLPEATRQR